MDKVRTIVKNILLPTLIWAYIIGAFFYFVPTALTNIYLPSKSSVIDHLSLNAEIKSPISIELVGTAKKCLAILGQTLIANESFTPLYILSFSVFSELTHCSEKPNLLKPTPTSRGPPHLA